MVLLYLQKVIGKKLREKKLFFVDVLKVTDEHSSCFISSLGGSVPRDGSHRDNFSENL